MDGPFLKSGMLMLLALLLGFDLWTKLTAYNDLPRGHKTLYKPGIGAILPVYNPVGFDAQNPSVERIFHVKPAQPVLQALLAASVVLIVMLLRPMKKSLFYKWSVGILLLFIASWNIQMAVPHLPQPDHGLIVAGTKILGLFAMLLYGQYCRTAYFKTAFTFMTAGAGGNYLSYCYPPFHPIDFLWSARLHGIFNLADVYIALGAALLFVSPLYLLLKFIFFGREAPAPVPPRRVLYRG